MNHLTYVNAEEAGLFLLHKVVFRGILLRSYESEDGYPGFKYLILDALCRCEEVPAVPQLSFGVVTPDGDIQMHGVSVGSEDELQEVQ